MILNLDKCIIVIFGASGDLTQRKLLPSLFGLYANNLMPTSFQILATGRSHVEQEDFIAKCRESIAKVKNNFLKPEQQDPTISQAILEEFLQCIVYQRTDAMDETGYAELKARLYQSCEELNIPANFIFYLSTPPSAYATIAQHLHSVGLADQSEGWRRLIIEKPFGYDVKTALELNKALHQYFGEDQLYRIDHYLGKETVQNILVFRFANALFEPIWNRNYISYVEITASEELGVEGRATYYDKSGALRDMFQNHLLNVLSFVAMEAPARIDADSIRDEQIKVIRSLRPITKETIHEQVVLAQYERDPDGLYRGYTSEDGVDPQSKTETYVQAKVQIDNWRWADVPFFVRTGKRMKAREAEVVIHFKKTPHQDFATLAPENRLVLRIQPSEAIRFYFGMKTPGSGFRFSEVSMDFDLKLLNINNINVILEAYQRLLLDAIRGDATLFTRSDFVYECWEYVQPILDYKERNPVIHKYPAGSWGPGPSVDLLKRAGFSWHLDDPEAQGLGK